MQIPIHRGPIVPLRHYIEVDGSEMIPRKFYDDFLKHDDNDTYSLAAHRVDQHKLSNRSDFDT